MSLDPEFHRLATENQLRREFRGWLAGLDNNQLAALAGNWENVMNDAALDRVDSWVIAGAALAELRREPAGGPE